MATGAMLALKRQSEEGGSWLVRVSLAQTGEWLWRLGRMPVEALTAADPGLEEVRDLLEVTASGFGAMTAVRHAGNLSETAPRFARPAMPLGSHAPVWPAVPAA